MTLQNQNKEGNAPQTAKVYKHHNKTLRWWTVIVNKLRAKLKYMKARYYVASNTILLIFY